MAGTLPSAARSTSKRNTRRRFYFIFFFFYYATINKWLIANSHSITVNHFWELHSGGVGGNICLWKQTKWETKSGRWWFPNAIGEAPSSRRASTILPAGACSTPIYKKLRASAANAQSTCTSKPKKSSSTYTSLYCILYMAGRSGSATTIKSNQPTFYSLLLFLQFYNSSTAIGRDSRRAAFCFSYFFLFPNITLVCGFVSITHRPPLSLSTLPTERDKVISWFGSNGSYLFEESRDAPRGCRPWKEAFGPESSPCPWRTCRDRACESAAALHLPAKTLWWPSWASARRRSPTTIEDLFQQHKPKQKFQFRKKKHFD